MFIKKPRPVNKEAQTFFSLLSLTLTKTDHGRCSLKTAVPMFYRLQERLHLVFYKVFEKYL